MTEGYSAIAADGSHVYLGSEGAKIEALSLDGRKLWSSELGGDISSNLVPVEKGLLLATSTLASDSPKATATLRNLSKETGITSWMLKLPNAGRYFLNPYNGFVIVVAQNGVVEAVDARDGTVKWKREIAEGFVAEPAFTPAKMIVATTGRQIFSISLASGEIESMRKSVYGVTALGELPTGEIVVGDERGGVSTMNGTDKPTWKFKSGGEISKIFQIGDSILATSHDNFIYYLLARNGDVDWKKRLSGRVMHLANITDKYALTMSFDDNNAVFTDLFTGKVAGQIGFADEEKLVSAPVAINGSIFLLTDRAVYSYSLGECLEKKRPAS